MLTVHLQSLMDIGYLTPLIVPDELCLDADCLIKKLALDNNLIYFWHAYEGLHPGRHKFFSSFVFFGLHLRVQSFLFLVGVQ